MSQSGVFGEILTPLQIIFLPAEICVYGICFCAALEKRIMQWVERHMVERDHIIEESCVCV